jgi:hypothetical protein
MNSFKLTPREKNRLALWLVFAPLVFGFSIQSVSQSYIGFNVDRYGSFLISGEGKILSIDIR